MPELKKNNPYVIIFNKPYSYEGTEYKEVDLSGLENLTTQDLAQADKEFISSGQVATTNELSVGYACIIGNKVTRKPVDFFLNLPAKEGVKLKNMVAGFLYE